MSNANEGIVSGGDGGLVAVLSKHYWNRETYSATETTRDATFHDGRDGAQDTLSGD